MSRNTTRREDRNKMLSNSITPESLGITPLAEDEVFRLATYGKIELPNRLISNYGRLYSQNKNIIMTPRIKHDKRIVYRVRIDGKEKEFFVHRLVAFAFVHNPNPDNFKIINHIDENPQNNKWDNLEWCTDKHNLNWGTAQERRALTRSKRICQYDKNMNVIAEYISMNEASRQTGIHLWTLHSDCKYDECKSGYYWQYMDSEVA